MPDHHNVILIQLDSLNHHFLAAYGNEWVQAPNLHAFAQKAAVFENHFVGSLPCMPARREIWAGTEEFWWRGWGPLEPWDQPIAYRARQANHPITTHLVTDHYHLFEWGSHNYNYDFHGYDFIRGHEYDNWRSDPIRHVPDWAIRMVERRGDEVLLYLRNVQDFEREEQFFGPQVMQTTADWLHRNHAQEHFFLHIDSFDVHEPFHVPEPYRSLYTDADYRQFNPWPWYGRTDQGTSALSPEEVEWVRAQFAGKLTMVDRWLGRVWDRLDEHRLWERTCVIVTTDHGHYLGEHGWMGKPQAPLYHTLCHIPLLVWHPDGVWNGGRVSATTQTVDLYATVLDLLGLEVPAVEHVQSRSFLPVLRGHTDNHRDSALYAYNNQRVGLTSGEWTLLRYHDPDAAPPLIYTQQIEQTAGFGYHRRQQRRLDFADIEPGRFLPGINTPVWRRQLGHDAVRHPTEPRDDLLFHNPSDPGQLYNLAAQRPDILQQMVEKLRARAQTVHAPDEQFARLHL